MNIKDMTKEELASTEATNAQADLADADDDALDAFLEKESGAFAEPDVEQEIAEQEATAETPEPAPDPEPVTEPAAEEKVEAAPPAEVEAAPAEEAATEEVEVTESDELKLQLEILQAQRNKDQAERDHWRLLADRNSGELGHIKKQLQDQAVEREPGAYDPEPAQPAQAVLPQEVADEIAEVRSERSRRAVETELTQVAERSKEFLESVRREGDEQLTAFHDHFKKIILDREGDFRDAMYGGDAKLATVTSRALFEGAMADARIDYLNAKMESIQKRRAARAAPNKEAKLDAGITQGAPTTTDTPAVKSISQMSDKELDDSLDAAVRSQAFGV